MLTLSNCGNEKHSGWWDFEAEIQKELEALDAHDNAYTSGNSQVEVVEEKENMNIVDRVADDFKNLLNRFHLQNEKLLYFEQSVFSSGKRTDALLEDSTAETAYAEVDLGHSYSSQSCFLTQQHLIRPLYCVDQEDNLCRLHGEREEEENNPPCKKKEGYPKKLVKEHRTILMPDILNVREMERVMGFPMDVMRNIQERQRIRTLKKAKDRCFYSLHLNYKDSMLGKLKLKKSDVKCQRRDFLLDIALILCQDKSSTAVSIELETGTASFINGCQTLGGKNQKILNQTKTAMAEIAKDWSFKEEKTALQFIRALNNTRRQAESPMTPKQGKPYCSEALCRKHFTVKSSVS